MPKGHWKYMGKKHNEYICSVVKKTVTSPIVLDDEKMEIYAIFKIEFPICVYCQLQSLYKQAYSMQFVYFGDERIKGVITNYILLWSPYFSRGKRLSVLSTKCFYGYLLYELRT